MPSKDIEKKRLAYRVWAAKNVEKRRNYQRILWIAKKNNPVPQKCKVDGCDKIGERHHPDYSKPAEIEWICKSHHRRVEHHGKCIICGDKSLSRGWCNKHYKSERQKIDSDFKERTRLSKLRNKSSPTRNRTSVQSCIRTFQGKSMTAQEIEEIIAYLRKRGLTEVELSFVRKLLELRK